MLSFLKELIASHRILLYYVSAVLSSHPICSAFYTDYALGLLCLLYCLSVLYSLNPYFCLLSFYCAFPIVLCSELYTISLQPILCLHSFSTCNLSTLLYLLPPLWALSLCCSLIFCTLHSLPSLYIYSIKQTLPVLSLSLLLCTLFTLYFLTLHFIFFLCMPSFLLFTQPCRLQI